MSQAENRNTTIPTRRALLAGAPAAAAVALAAGTAVNGLAIAAASPSAPDPIFALIQAHRETILAFGPAIDRSEQMEPDEGEAYSTAASYREIDALKAVLTTPPTTLAGIVALLDHLAQPEWFNEDSREDTILPGAMDSACEEARDFPHLLATTVRSMIATKH